MVAKSKDVINLIKSISGQANVIAIPRLYIDLLEGDISTAMLLSQIVYWSDKSKRKDGYFYKSVSEWCDELGLSRYKVTRAINKLEEYKYIDTVLKRANGAPTLHYKLDFGFLTNSIIKKLDYQETDKSDYKETSKSDLPETDKSLTEITQDITTESQTSVENSFDPDKSGVEWWDNLPRMKRIDIYHAATKRTPDIGMHEIVIDKMTDVMRIHKLENAYFFGIYLSPFFEAWCKMKRPNGIPYRKTNPNWLDLAIDGKENLPTPETAARQDENGGGIYI